MRTVYLSLLLLSYLGCAPTYIATDESSSSDRLPSFASRSDFLQRLEPRGDRILFGSGIDFDPFTDRSSLERTQPAYYEVAYDLATLPYDWYLPLRDLLARHEHYLLLQIDVGMASAGQSYAQAVSDGRLDEAIDALCFGLTQLGRPAFLRVGPECNNPWNDYDPESYQRAWQRLAQTLRDRWNLQHVALVWSIAADGHREYMALYPGDEYVDWWSIDVYTPAELNQRTAHSFVAEAAERSYPVLLETATPMSRTPKSGDELWRQWFDPLFEFLRQTRNIKALSYRDWAEFRRAGDAVAAERFQLELSDPTYQQATTLEELRWFLEWD